MGAARNINVSLAMSECITCDVRMYHLRCSSVSLAMFEMFDFVSDPVDFVECDESGCKGQDMECEVDKEVFVPAMAMLMIFFHNL